jgi:hypothetical protein
MRVRYKHMQAVLSVCLIASAGCPEEDTSTDDTIDMQTATANTGDDSGTVSPSTSPAGTMRTPSMTPTSGPVAEPDQGSFDGKIVAAAMDEAVGGFPVPVWLYKGGVYPTDDDGLLPIPGEAVKHRAANPDLWSAWRRTPNGVERKIGRDWSPLAYDDEYAALAAGTRVNATFNSSADRYQERKYRFTSAGRFEYCREIAVASLRPEYGSGTYEVDGYVIRLRYSGGTVETLSFVYDPKLRPNSLWVDGSPFKRDNTVGTSALACP